ncbi:MAG: nicotinate-nucleotide-dimethylbenzimidazole phosphoribosyltransferase [Acidimicrobiales bacterium]|nr:nicotinate-nucleotide-dimethylbenzimidazole phosphoribosyltransferase [Acidimicrobiales bacterium]
MTALPLPFDAVVFDIGGTLVAEAAPGTPVDRLRVAYLDGAPRTVHALATAGLALAAVTDTSVMTEADVRALLARDGVSDLLTELVTSFDLGAAKPDPAGILEVLRRLGIADPARALFVGDRDVDRDAAAAAGCGFARVRVDEPLPETLRRAFVVAGASPIAAAAALVAPVDEAAATDADARQLRLTKPAGALGRLEQLGTQLAAISGIVPPPVPEPAAVGVFAGDHGVLDEGVSPWPREVTAQMIANVAGGGAAVSVLARQAGASVTVVDVGVATPWPEGAAVLDRNVRRGTANLAQGPAMTTDEALAALSVGASLAADLVADGARVLLTGDMGIGNTTPSAALVSLFTGLPPYAVTGRGTGIDDPTLITKIAVIERATERARGTAGDVSAGERVDPVTALAEVGGLEHAAIAGFIIGGAAARVPVVIDGVIATAALLAAHALVPGVLPYVIGGHRSVEPGASAALTHLDVEPLVDLCLRLGEGTGAVLALPIVQAAARILGEMATFDEAGVTDKDRAG